MLRIRLLTSLVFNLVVALWVLHDAIARRARKPWFAAVLALMWGPLGLGLWESDRPLRQGEQRRGGPGSNLARGFLIGWIALLPAMFVLALQATEHRSAVPGSLGRQLGIVPAAALTTSMFWCGPAVLAVILGGFARRPTIEHGSSAAPAASLPSWLAAALGGAAALAFVLAMSKE
jgi:hypothetical protein